MVPKKNARSKGDPLESTGMFRGFHTATEIACKTGFDFAYFREAGSTAFISLSKVHDSKNLRTLC